MSNETDPQKRQLAQQYFVRGSDAIKQENYDYAITMLKDACKYAPDQFGFRQQLRFAQRRKWKDNGRGGRMASVKTMKSRTALKASKAKKETHRAIEITEDILAENPWDTGMLVEMAGLLQQIGQLQASVWHGELALQNNPKDAHTNRFLAKLYENCGQFTKAMDCWERVKNANPSDADAARKLQQLAASATINKGGYEDAQSFTEAIADKDRTQQLVDDVKGGEVKQLNQQQLLERKIRQNPTDAAAYLQLSAVFRKQEKYDDARRIVREARDACGANNDIETELADIDLDALRKDLEIARAAVKAGDESAKQKEKELRRAVIEAELREFQRRVDRNPTDLDVKVDLGIRLAQSGRYKEAVTELQKARNSSRRQAEVHIWQGHCFWAMKQMRLCRGQYEAALEVLPGDDEKNIKELHYRLGRLCENSNETEEAIKHYEVVAGMDFGFKDVADRLSKLSGSSEDPEEDGIPLDLD